MKMQQEMKQANDKMKKKLKKTEKKRVRLNNQQIFLLPIFMYAGAGRHMVSFDNKRKYVKVS